MQYAPLVHAPWHGYTLTDLVFPSFLFVVGCAFRLSMKKLGSMEDARFLPTVATLLAAGAAFLINKKLWTSSYVVVSIGSYVVALAVLVCAIDMKGLRAGIGGPDERFTLASYNDPHMF